MNIRSTVALLALVASSAFLLAPNSAAGAEDWRSDRPGLVHRIVSAQLPPPFATDSARRRPQVLARPATATLAVPPKFKVNVFASGLKNPRVLRIAPNGDVLLSEPDAGRITVMHPSADFSKAVGIQTFAQGLNQPYGL